jgi:uncharacterized DUF497 family protein
MTDLLPLTIDDYSYGAQTVGHIAKHQVTIAEVDEVLSWSHAVTPAKFGRYMAIGITDAGRCLVIILAPMEPPGRYELVTARTAKPKERKAYIRYKLGGQSNG